MEIAIRIKELLKQYGIGVIEKFFYIDIVCIDFCRIFISNEN